MSQLNTISFVRNSFINFDMNGESGGIGIEVENEVNSNKLKLIYEDCSFINTQIEIINILEEPFIVDHLKIHDK